MYERDKRAQQTAAWAFRRFTSEAHSPRNPFADHLRRLTDIPEDKLSEPAFTALVVMEAPSEVNDWQLY